MANTSILIPSHVQRLLSTHAYVLGVDEAGIGSWAGPAVACGVVVPVGWTLEGLTDSKRLSAAWRERLFAKLTVESPVLHFGVRVDAEDIDKLGMARALPWAHRCAIEGALKLHAAAGHQDGPLVIVDGLSKLAGVVPLPKADLLIQAVSAASIIAKVAHDRIMKELDALYPGYGLASHQGYGSPQHRAALERLGVSRCHRMSYAPMRALAQRDGNVIEDLCEVS